MPTGHARTIKSDHGAPVAPVTGMHEPEPTVHPERNYVSQQLRGLARSIEQSSVRSEPITPTERASALTILSEVMGHVTQGQG